MLGSSSEIPVKSMVCSDCLLRESLGVAVFASSPGLGSSRFLLVPSYVLRKLLSTSTLPRK